MRGKFAFLVASLPSVCLAAGLTDCSKQTAGVGLSADAPPPGQTQGVSDGSTFRFPDNPDGKMLAALLTPVEKIAPAEHERVNEPRKLPASPVLQMPELQLPLNDGV